jgi:putative phosphoserine phosphatase/1-acylglycerol-3-phosphate O-acyltransferase
VTDAAAVPRAPRRTPPLKLLAGWLRALLVMVSVVVALLVGLGLFAVWRDRQRAANAMIGSWARVAPRVAGLRLEVRHAERIDASRPAVFLFNHQSAADILILCMLLRRDFTGVSKEEIRRNWVLGPAFAFAGAVFIDRFNRPKAIAALQPAVDVLRGGISVGIAPEGTRSVGGKLGPFKKGAFRLALAARVPVVPIVIHDSYRVVPRKTVAVNAATVHVDVLEPISTEDWTLETLDARIAEIRQRYLERLTPGAPDLEPSS